MKNVITTCLLLVVSYYVHSQSDTILAYPIMGLQKLSVKALGIEFPSPLREKIQGLEVEFIFDVDEYGVGNLAEINGVNEAAIKDSFQNVFKPFVLFKPLLIDSVPYPSFFFFRVIFPTYQKSGYQPVYIIDRFSFQRLKLSDFETIEFSKHREEISLGGFYKRPVSGHIYNYLGGGGGMDIDLSYLFPKILVGLNLNVSGSKRIKLWPELNTSIEQPKYPSALHCNLYGGYHKGNKSIQVEAGFSLMNLIFNSNEKSNDGIQKKGSNFAVTYKYKLPISKDKPTTVYGTPYILRYDLHFLMRSRLTQYDYKYVNGFSLEIGCAIATHYKRIKNFKLKNKINN